MDFWNMHIELVDIVGLLIALAPVIGVYVSLRRELSEVKVVLEIQNKAIEKADVERTTLARDINQENRETWKKLATIEAVQMETNVYLKENLKRLTEITERLTTDLSALDRELQHFKDSHNKDINEIYKKDK